MEIGHVLNGVYDQSVGWRPATGQLKPAHIANGLFRGLLGEVYDVKRTVAFIIPWAKKNSPLPDPKKTYDHLVHGIKDPRFQAFRDERGKERFERLREFARELLNADGAVFPTGNMASFSISCRELISNDKMDREVGRFMAELLRGGDGNLARLVVDCLKDDQPSDPITLLAWPLLNHDAEHVEKDVTRCSPYADPYLADFFKSLEKAADHLAGHQRAQGNRLATLQKAVQFSCLSLLAHAQALSVNGALGKRSPMLLTIDAVKGSRLAVASEESLFRLYESFENWLAEKLAERVEKGSVIDFGSNKGDDEYLPKLPAQRKDSVRNYLNGITGKSEEPVKTDLMDERMSYWEQAVARHGRENSALVMGETLVQCYLNECESSGPKQFLGGIGRKAGIIYPHYQGRSRDKRIQPSVAILDMIVQSCTPCGESIRLNEFLDLLWERFGIVVGGRTGDEGNDHDLLTNRNINISQSDLEENAKAFVNHLVDIGLARRYPDNIAYVGRHYA